MPKGVALLRFRSADGNRIGHTPMRRHRLSPPVWTLLGGRLIADRKDEIEARRVRPRKFVPALAPQAVGGEVLFLQERQPSDAALMSDGCRR